MLKIGIIGDEDGIASECLREILEQNQKKVYFSAISTSDAIRKEYLKAVSAKTHIILFDIQCNEGYEQMGALKFDILLFLMHPKKEEIALQALLKSKNYLIIDSDDLGVKRILVNKDTTVITCGFNHFASVTISSVEWEFAQELQFCVQRTLKTIDGGEIEPQEIKYLKPYEDHNIINILAAVVAAVLSGARI